MLYRTSKEILAKCKGKWHIFQVLLTDKNVQTKTHMSINNNYHHLLIKTPHTVRNTWKKSFMLLYVVSSSLELNSYLTWNHSLFGFYWDPGNIIFCNIPNKKTEIERQKRQKWCQYLIINIWQAQNLFALRKK